MTYPKLVSWRYYNGTNIFLKTPEKEEITKVYAQNAKAEEILKTGQIAALDPSVRHEDPYFKIVSESGVTKRAKSYGKLKRKMTDNFPELENRLTNLSGVLKPYGDYIYIKLNYLNNYVNPFVKTDICHSQHFILKSKFTIDNIIKIIEYKPKSIMNGVIDRYQNEEIPNFLLALKIEFPELYNELKLKSEKVKNLEPNLTYVGKTAYVTTLNPGDVELRLSLLGEQTFYWNGSELTNSTKAYDGSIVKQSIQPSDNTTVKILTNKSVNTQTKFID